MEKPNKPGKVTVITDSIAPTLEEDLAVVEALVDQGESPGKAVQKSRMDLEAALEDQDVSSRLLSLIQNWYLNDTEAEAAVRARLLDLLMNAEDEKAQVAAAKELRGWVQKQQEKGVQVGGLLAQFFAGGPNQ